MRGFRSSGLELTLTLKDKRSGERRGKIVGKLDDGEKINMYIKDTRLKRSCEEESWFHIESIPRNSKPQDRTGYTIWIKKEKFAELTNPTGNPSIDGGYIVSRSKFDRVDIKYYAI